MVPISATDLGLLLSALGVGLLLFDVALGNRLGLGRMQQRNLGIVAVTLLTVGVYTIALTGP